MGQRIKLTGCLRPEFWWRSALMRAAMRHAAAQRLATVPRLLRSGSKLQLFAGGHGTRRAPVKRT
jgi:hypothetical protein